MGKKNSPRISNGAIDSWDIFLKPKEKESKNETIAAGVHAISQSHTSIEIVG